MKTKKLAYLLVFLIAFFSSLPGQASSGDPTLTFSASKTQKPGEIRFRAYGTWSSFCESFAESENFCASHLRIERKVGSKWYKVEQDVDFDGVVGISTAKVYPDGNYRFRAKYHEVATGTTYTRPAIYSREVSIAINDNPVLRTPTLYNNSTLNDYYSNRVVLDFPFSTGSGVDYVKVEKRENNGQWFVVSSNQSQQSMTLSGSQVNSGSNYQFRIAGCNYWGCDEYSNIVSVQIPINNPPVLTISSPELGGDYVAGDNLTIRGEVADSEGLDNVTVYGRVNRNGSLGPQFVIKNIDTSSFSVNAANTFATNWIAEPGVVAIWIVATDIYGKRSSTDVGRTISVSDNHPPTVQLLNTFSDVLYDGDTITLSATASDSDGTVETVEFRANGASLGIATKQNDQYELSWTPTTAGEYQVDVVATDNEGTQSISNTVLATITALTVPDAPSIEEIISEDFTTIGENAYRVFVPDYTLRWGFSYTADQYKLEVLDDGVWNILQQDNRRGYLVDNAFNGLNQYRVSACNRKGCGAARNIDVEVDVTEPLAPDNVSLTPAGIISGDYSISWNNSQSSNYYQIQVKNGSLDSESSWVDLVQIENNTTLDIIDQTPGLYNYRIAACNNGGCSEYGEIVTARVAEPNILSLNSENGATKLDIYGVAFHPSSTVTLSSVANTDILVRYAAADIQRTINSSQENVLSLEVQNVQLIDAVLQGQGIQVQVNNPNGSSTSKTLVLNEAETYTSLKASGVTVANDGTLYLAVENKVFALDGQTGEVKFGWPFEADGTVQSTPVIDAEGNIYFGSNDDHFYAVNPQGVSFWKLDTGSDIVADAAIDERGIVYFGSMGGVIYAVHGISGQIKWQYPANQPIAAAPVLTGDGNTLYYSTVYGEINAIGRGVLGPDTLVWESPSESLLAQDIALNGWQPDRGDLPEYLRVGRLYQAVFPDYPLNREVLSFWTYATLNKASLVEAASAFLNSDLPPTLSLVDSTSEQFVEELYLRIFQLEEGEEKPLINYASRSYSHSDLVELLGNGTTREKVITLLSDSQQNTLGNRALVNAFDYFYTSKFEDFVFQCETGTVYERDCDMDGLPDWWEITYFGDIESQTALTDADDDGVSNQDEWLQDQDPCQKGCYEEVVAESQTPALPQSIPQTAIDKSYEVASVAGEFRVNESGAATYSVPIYTPEGVAGVTPSVSLNYSSQGGNGLVGKGWSISASGAISRCSKTLVQDKEYTQIEWNQNDRFCFNGQRLLVIQGEYGVPGSVYKTAIDGFVKVKAHGGVAGSPEYFTVSQKDGSVSYYGHNSSTNNSKNQTVDGKTLNWALSHSEDSVGNRIDYEYRLAGGHRLSTISYAGGVTEIQFVYQERPDSISNFISGYGFLTDKRLSEVKVFNDNEEVRQYDVDYFPTANGWNNTSKLVSISESVNGIKKPKTEFEWSVYESGYNSPIDWVDLAAEDDTYYATHTPADINGDGLMDFVWLETDAGNSIKGYNFNAAVAKLDAGRVRFVIDDNFLYEKTSDSMPTRFNMVDYNSDGRTDLVYFDREVNQWKVHLSQPDKDLQFNGDWRISSEPIASRSLSDIDTKFSDFNGDGLVDALSNSSIYYGEKVEARSIESKAFYRLGQPKQINYIGEDFDFEPGYETALKEFAAGFMEKEYYKQIRNLYMAPFSSDINGDGKIDQLVVTSTVNGVEEAYSPRGSQIVYSEQVELWLADFDTQSNEVHIKQKLDFPNADMSYDQALIDEIKDYLPAEFDGTKHFQEIPIRLTPTDLNADGLTDIVLQTKETVDSKAWNTYAQISSGGTLGSFDFIQKLEEFETLQPADINFDGSSELLYTDLESSGIYVLQWSKGETSPERFKLLSLPSDFKGKTDFMDVSGDGRLDLVRVEDNVLSVSLSKADGDPLEKIIGITNGLGAKTEIRYESLPLTTHYSLPQLPMVQETQCEDRQQYWNNKSGSFDRRYSEPAIWCETFNIVDAAGFYAELNGFNQGMFAPQYLESGLQLPAKPLMSPLQVVTQVQSSSPVVAGYDSDVDHKAGVSYYYETARFQAGGRGMLGFKSLTTIDHQNGVETKTEYHQDFPFTGSPKKTTVKAPKEKGGHIISQATKEWSVTNYGSLDLDAMKQSGTAALGPIQVQMTQSVEKKFDPLTGDLLSQTDNQQEYDEFGNVVENTIINKDADGNPVRTKNVKHTYGNQIIDFQNSDHQLTTFAEMGRLTRSVVDVEDHKTLDTTSRTVGFEYYESGAIAGLLKKEIVEPDATGDDEATLKLVTEYEYDQFGNKKKVTKSGAGVESRSSSNEYTADGRYLKKTTNAYGQATKEVLTRNALGQPLSVRDIAGNETNFVYNQFGRKLLEYNDLGQSTLTMAEFPGMYCSDVPAASYQVRTETNSGKASIECFDKTNRSLRKATQGFDGQWVFVDTYYNDKGRVFKTSEPYRDGDGIYFSEVEYDFTGRPVKATAADGSVSTMRYEGLTTVTTNALLQTKSETKNVLGELETVIDHLGNQIFYHYNVDGEVKRVRRLTAQGNEMVTRIEYDRLGRKIAMQDPDKGSWSYQYNAFGELKQQTSSRGSVVNIEYDLLGRKVRREDVNAFGSVETTAEWIFNNTEGKLAEGVPPAGLMEVTTTDGYSQSYKYDNYGRLSEKSTQFAGSDAYQERITYDQFGREYQIFDAAGDGTWQGQGIKNVYNNYGYLSQVVDVVTVNQAPRYNYYQILETDARGNVTRYLTANGVETVKEYEEDTGHISQITAYAENRTRNVQDLSYEWDAVGNLSSRIDSSAGKYLHEVFGYDDLNRLTSVTLNNTGDTQSMQYDGFGNIVFKSDVGDYEYDYANAGNKLQKAANDDTFQYDEAGNIKAYAGKVIDYTTFDKPSRIESNGHTTEFDYGPDRSRYQRIDRYADGRSKTTHYIGNVERISHSNGSSEIKRRLPGGTLITISETSSGEVNESLTVVHKDHLGSVDVITDIRGQVIQKFSFDPWGQRRDSDSWQAFSFEKLIAFDNQLTTRGFTGHEMLDEVGLIHMNGRIYDARLARFVQADPNVDGATQIQGYARYTYVKNNPLNATDPTGFFIKSLLRTLAKEPILNGIIQAAGCYAATPVGCIAFSGIYSGAQTYAVTGDFAVAMRAGVIATASSAVSYSIGGQYNAGKISLQRAAFYHGVTQGIATEMQGGKFGHGFASAFVSKMANVNDRIGVDPADKFDRVLTAAVIGGTTSIMTGGKFVNGAVTAAYVQLLNGEPTADKKWAQQQAAQNVNCPVDECITVVLNDLNIEEAGTIKYIGNPPKTVPVTGATAEALQCFADTCTPGGVLAVTGGAEQYDAQGKLLHSRNSTHYPSNGGRAIDLSGWRNDNSLLTDQLVNACALACGFTHGQWEKNHWHLQIGPGNGSRPLPMKER